MGSLMRAVILVLFLAGLIACGSADDDPVQRVEKPVSVAASVPQEK